MEELPDGTTLYTLDEAEGMEFETYDIYLYELVLIYFGLKPRIPLSIEEVQKGVYELYTGLRRRGYKVQNPHYINSGNKTFSPTVERILNNLWWSGYLEISVDDKLILTEKGEEEAGALIKRKLKEDDIKDLVQAGKF